ncbi:CMGC/SRPK protein kinase [Roridomyces roridus]|uniref:non-specific serine/threonine protein kinase n=1 Tax=Roridomyces roridus TaxID=1738132 RepID=A0AAD7BU05_9AGAR|nr:CMGC/SRPK protein kinase [Roridomyces roridus]
MAPSTLQGAKYVFAVQGPKLIPVDEPYKDEENASEYNAGGYCPVKLTDTFKNGRYSVLRKLGWGHFSTVWLVKDEQENRHSALKVVKSAGRYAETARDEIKLLSRVASIAPMHPGRQHIVSFLDSFAHQGPESSHICIVFEPLGEHLLALIERNRRKGVPRALVKVIAKQVLLGLEYLHDECDLVHTDIKPENIRDTPPTSLSNSFGSVMAVINATKDVAAPLPIPGQPHERVGLPMKGKKHMNLESELESALSSSWKDKMGLTRDGVSSKATPIKLRHGHTRSSSGISVSESWKDPGLSAPAPALVVSAVVRADGEQHGDYFQTAGTSSSFAESSSAANSESSSATVTKARPSPNGTPPASAKSKSNGFKIEPALDSNGETDSNFSTVKAEKRVMPGNPAPSLLSQTAPRTRIAGDSSAKHNVLRVSPPHHTSQLSAHMHTHPPPPPSPSSLDSANEPRPVVNPAVNSPCSATSLTPTGESLPPQSPITIPSPRPQVQTPALALPKPRPSNIPEISIKIADLGNATPSKKHFTEDIQTRQYRSPEAIIGRKDWDARADIWSVACLVFELLTAEFLFDPQGQGDLFSKDDDQMAQIIELLGDFPMHVKMGGKYSHELFDSTGALRFIRTLKPWPLRRVMQEKYLWNETDAGVLCTFIEPMLAVDPRDRKNAREMLDHPWLDVSEADDVVGVW